MINVLSRYIESAGRWGGGALRASEPSSGPVMDIFVCV